jgi:hypothetical protein
MRSVPRIAVVAVLAFAWLAPGAHAEEAPDFGVSVDGYVAPVWDDSVTNLTPGQSADKSRGLIGLATLANAGTWAAGGVIDGFPGILGNGRLTVGGMAGWQPQVGTHRFQVLGELGAERFSDVGGNLFASPSTHETWLQYVGARLGTSETLGASRHFELGAWFFVRKDLNDATVSSTSDNFLGGDSTTTQIHLGGYSAGAALRVGLRFDRRYTPSESAAGYELAGI